MRRWLSRKVQLPYKISQRIDPVGLLLPIIFMMIWYLATLVGGVPSYILPSPQKLVQVLVDFTVAMEHYTPYAGKLMENLTASVLRVLGGFGLAAVTGLTLGMLTGRNVWAKRFFDPLIHMLRAVPGIGWLPLAMIWFGVGEKTTLFLIALAAFFPIYVNTAHGAAGVSPMLLRAARMLGADKVSLFTTVILPAAFPSIVVGLRLGLGVAWAYLVLGELTGVAKGLGAVMMDSRMLGHVDMVLAAMICIAILGKMTDTVLMAICNRLYPLRDGIGK